MTTLSKKQAEEMVRKTLGGGFVIERFPDGSVLTLDDVQFEDFKLDEKLAEEIRKLGTTWGMKGEELGHERPIEELGDIYAYQYVGNVAPTNYAIHALAYNEEMKKGYILGLPHPRKVFVYSEDYTIIATN